MAFVFTVANSIPSRCADLSAHRQLQTMVKLASDISNFIEISTPKSHDLFALYICPQRLPLPGVQLARSAKHGAWKK